MTHQIDRLPYARPLARGFAYLIDSAIAFGAFAVVQFFMLAPLRTGLGISPEWFHNGWNTELYTLATISIPIWLYFALMERSGWQATIGKRLLRLIVADASSFSRIGFGQSLLRTIVKLLPWEIAHVANNLPVPMMYADDPALRLGFALAGVLFVAYVAFVFVHSRHLGPHDMVAGTLVLKRTDQPESPSAT